MQYSRGPSFNVFINTTFDDLLDLMRLKTAVKIATLMRRINQLRP